MEADLDTLIPDEWCMFVPYDPWHAPSSWTDVVVWRPTWRDLYRGEWPLLAWSGEEASRPTPRWVIDGLDDAALDLYLRTPSISPVHGGHKVVEALHRGRAVSPTVLAERWQEVRAWLQVGAAQPPVLPPGAALTVEQQRSLHRLDQRLLIRSGYAMELDAAVFADAIDFDREFAVRHAADAMDDATFNACLLSWTGWDLQPALAHPERWSDEAIDHLLPWALDSFLAVPALAARLTPERLEGYAEVRAERLALGCEIATATRVPPSWASDPYVQLVCTTSPRTHERLRDEWAGPMTAPHSKRYHLFYPMDPALRQAVIDCLSTGTQERIADLRAALTAEFPRWEDLSLRS